MKKRSAAGSIGKAYFATEAVDDLLDDAQPEARPALLSRRTSVGLRKFLENERLEVDRNARTVVAHCKPNRIAAFGDRDCHLIARRRKLDCIRQQVGNDL